MLDRKLVALAEGRLKKLIVGIPVRHGKSELCSTYFPAYLFGKWPDESVMWVGHTAELANDYGGAAREVIETHGRDLYGIGVDRTSRRKTSWKIAGHRGRYTGRGVRGSFPSKGGRGLIIDDPTKSPAEAFSKLAQDQLEKWYTGIARSRLDPNGFVLLVMSRWQPLDLAGRLMRLWDNIGEPYEYLHMRAIADGGPDPLGRPRGAALWPQRYDEVELTAIRKEVGEETWFAQFENDPLPERGEYFDRKWFRRFELRTVLGVPTLIAIGDVDRGEPDRTIALGRCRIMQYVDLATALPKPGTDPDYFVITTVAVDRERKDIYVLHVLRDRVPGPDQIPTLVDSYKTFRPYRQKIESVGYQLSSVQSAVRAGLPAEPIDRKRGEDKGTRANYISQRFKQGAVFLPYRAEWLHDFEAELVAFPRGHDDQVDTLADAGNDLLSPEMDMDSDRLAVASAR